MNDTFATVLIAASLLLAIWPLVLVIRNAIPSDWLVGALAVLEAGLLAQLVVGIILLAGTDRPVPALEFVAYLVGVLLVLPVTTFWALAERSRWGTSVLIIGLLVVPVMVVRMQQIWERAGA